MAGGISYVLDRVLKHGKSSARKGNYYLEVIRDRNDILQSVNLVHYGTNILMVDYHKQVVSGGYSSVSSAAAVNVALRALRLPCWWSYAHKTYGFHCSGGWKGNPEFVKKTRDLVAVEDYEYSPTEKKHLAKLRKRLYPATPKSSSLTRK